MFAHNTRRWVTSENQLKVGDNAQMLEETSTLLPKNKIKNQLSSLKCCINENYTKHKNLHATLASIWNSIKGDIGMKRIRKELARKLSYPLQIPRTITYWDATESNNKFG